MRPIGVHVVVVAGGDVAVEGWRVVTAGTKVGDWLLGGASTAALVVVVDVGAAVTVRANVPVVDGSVDGAPVARTKVAVAVIVYEPSARSVGPTLAEIPW